MGDLLNFPEAGQGGADGMSLSVDFNPFFEAIEPVVSRADHGPDQAAVLTGYLRRAARGIESVGFFRVEELPGGVIRVSAHIDPALAGLFQSPQGAA